MEKQTHRPVRPNSVESRVQDRMGLPSKVIVALEVIDQMTSLQHGFPVSDEDGKLDLLVQELRPKEDACYSSALDFIERYLDSD